MEYVLRIDVSDSLSVESLEKARKCRRMARLVTDALAHYVRTKEGRASIDILTMGSGRSGATKARVGAKKDLSVKISKHEQPRPETVTICDFLKITQQIESP